MSSGVSLLPRQSEVPLQTGVTQKRRPLILEKINQPQRRENQRETQEAPCEEQDSQCIPVKIQNKSVKLCIWTVTHFSRLTYSSDTTRYRDWTALQLVLQAQFSVQQSRNEVFFLVLLNPSSYWDKKQHVFIFPKKMYHKGLFSVRFYFHYWRSLLLTWCQTSVCTLMLLATKKCGQKRIVGGFYSRSYLIPTHPCSWYAASVGTHTQNLSGPAENISADSCKMHRMTRRNFPATWRGNTHRKSRLSMLLFWREMASRGQHKQLKPSWTHWER